MSKKGFTPIVIVLIIALLSAGGITGYVFIKNKPPKIIGGDTDSHGCLISAGYSWCEAKQKCLRTWEESCEETTTTLTTITTTEPSTTTTKLSSSTTTTTTTTLPSVTNYGSISKCKSDCLEKGFEDGDCKWPMEMSEEFLESTEYPYEKVENFGPCFIIFTKHCGNEGQCNCYCFDNKK
ncbi:MAG: hypothetical protein WC306_01700 [Candidatus Paceibacterota bacterium]|jgi:hypothetical protein